MDMDLSRRVTRTFVGVLLAVLLGMLLAPLNAIHPRGSRAAIASVAAK
ncbi:MAG TPA: hypothetical protein VFV78_03960 [Vicinamibacterales bacterium]|nr:hypothetical protein [Vicinamibacterales bacterium]